MFVTPYTHHNLIFKTRTGLRDIQEPQINVSDVAVKVANLRYL